MHGPWYSQLSKSSHLPEPNTSIRGRISSLLGSHYLSIDISTPIVFLLHFLYSLTKYIVSPVVLTSILELWRGTYFMVSFPGRDSNCLTLLTQLNAIVLFWSSCSMHTVLEPRLKKSQPIDRRIFLIRLSGQPPSPHGGRVVARCWAMWAACECHPIKKQPSWS